jgi:hypothetical protein
MGRIEVILKKEISHIDVSIGGMYNLRFWPEGVTEVNAGHYVCVLPANMVEEAAQAGKYLEILLKKEKNNATT